MDRSKLTNPIGLTSAAVARLRRMSDMSLAISGIGLIVDGGLSLGVG